MSSHDNIGITIAKVKKYSDVQINFLDNPVTGDIGRINTVASVKNSVSNCILTIKGEKPFNPFFGSNIRNLLFEPFTPITLSIVKDEVRSALDNYEPRIIIEEIEVLEIPNGFNIVLSFIIKNTKVDDVVEELTATVTRIR